MKTQQNENIKEINLDSFSRINSFLKKVKPIEENEENEENESVELKIGFYSHYELICNISCLLDGISILSIDSNAPEKDNLRVIYALSNIGRKLIPFEEMDFLDDMMFKKSYRDNENFEKIENLTKNLKNAVK